MRAKSVLNMMMMSFIALAIVPVLWVLYGYSFSFSPGGNRWLPAASSDSAWRQPLRGHGVRHPAPEYVFVAFQLMFAIITVALISGAIADRAKFSAWSVFVVIWMTVVYFPVAHWVFDFGDNGGWIATKLEAFDFAGGTAVHINAGAAGLALALVLGKRVGWKRDPIRPRDLPSCCSARLAVGSLVRLQRQLGRGCQRLAGLAFVNTADRHGCRDHRLAPGRGRQGGQGHVARQRLGCGRGSGRHHAGLWHPVAVRLDRAQILVAGAMCLGGQPGVQAQARQPLDVVGIHLVGRSSAPC